MFIQKETAYKSVVASIQELFSKHADRKFDLSIKFKIF